MGLDRSRLEGASVAIEIIIGAKGEAMNAVEGASWSKNGRGKHKRATPPAS